MKICNIHFNFFNILKFYPLRATTLPKNNLTRQCSNNTKEKLNPYWVTGFSDAEGCFTVSISRRSNLSNSWNISTSFEINLHTKDLSILLQLKKFFGVGIVSTKPNRNISVFRVTKNKDLLNVIIPHFLKYPLISQKYSDFVLWSKVVEMIKNKEHLTPLGFKKVLSFYSSINRGASKTVSNLFPDIVKAQRPVFALPLVLDPNWVSGFSAGDAGFSIGVRITTGQIYFRFHIAQHSRDREMIKLFISFFKCGRVNVRGNRCDFYVQDMSKIAEFITPHFKYYPLENIKHLDYLDFVKGLELFKKGGKNNIKEIRDIISGMNSKRKF